jgi:xanthine dehydrogenase accessory factor
LTTPEPGYRFQALSRSPQVKHWKETAEIFARARLLVSAEKRAAIATVVRIEGSAYRRPGAKLLVEEDGSTAGGVSGGCLEADVREVGQSVMRDGVPRLLHYETSDDDSVVWGLGLGCSGTVDVFVQPVTQNLATEILGRAGDLLIGDARFLLSTVVRGDSGLGRTAGRS